MKVAFDIGGVLSKYPTQFRGLIRQLRNCGTEVFVITDMHDHAQVVETLRLNGFDMIPSDHVKCADYAKHGKGCKAELLKELKIDMFFDDFLGYLAIPNGAIRLLVMPDATLPYWADEWKTDSPESEFGRRVYKKS